jgi:hypothetical protein
MRADGRGQQKGAHTRDGSRQTCAESKQGPPPPQQQLQQLLSFADFAVRLDRREEVEQSGHEQTLDRSQRDCRPRCVRVLCACPRCVWVCASGYVAKLARLHIKQSDWAKRGPAVAEKESGARGHDQYPCAK